MTPSDSPSLPVDPASAAAGYEAIIAGHVATIAAQEATIVALLARVAELERRLGLNSSNSSKPPSSDGPAKPVRVRSLREPSGKKPGGQHGHPGKTLAQVANPDETLDHYPTGCRKCGLPFGAATSSGYAARQIFDLPPPPPLIVTEHRAHRCLCTTCGTITQAAFPQTVSAPVQYGARIAAFVVYLINFQFIPEDRLATLMADLFDVHLSRATIAQMSSRAAKRLQPFADAVRDLIISAPIKHLDETGFRIGGRTQWLHIAATLWLTFYRVSTKRGDLLSGVSGIIVHDHWKPYYTMKGVLHALCNSHHLRELQALRDIEHEDWARRMQIVLRRACHATNLARAKGTTLNQRLVGLIDRRYDAIVAQGIAFHEAQTALATKPKKDGTSRKGRPPRRVGHNLLLRLSGRKLDVLRFVTNLDVPFTNTEAERAARMMKAKQKISGGFRTEEGAREFAVIRTMIATARKKGWNIIESLLHDTQDLIIGLSSA